MEITNSPPNPPADAMATLEEFLNLDLLSGSGGSSSRGSSLSPDSAFLGLPQTPPQPVEHNVPLVAGDAQSLFSFYFEKDLEKIQEQPATFAPYDLFGPFSPQDSNSASSASPVLHDDPNFFAIDPQLMAMSAPQPAPVPPPPASESPLADDDEEDDDDIAAFLSQPVKVGGKGKAARRGTVASGGVKKFGGQAVRDTDDLDDWRPTVEEYRKMSSKEKRQLRNKISARNFRVRRKEYITTLEGDVSERDKLIDLIRQELGATKLENAALRKEVDALKRAMLEGRAAPTLPPPGPLDAVVAATDAATAPAPTTRRRAAATPLAKANTQKDLPTTSPRSAAARPFWGGASALGGGITPVHTTLVPDLVSLIGTLDTSKPAAPAPVRYDEPENMNPALNGAPPRTHTVNSVTGSGHAGGFDRFTDLNPFTIKNLEAYRMQLWSKMARDAAANNSPRMPPPPPPPPVAGVLKPMWSDAERKPAADSPKAPRESPIIAALLAGKGVVPQSAPAPKATPDPVVALAAGMASMTLMSRMTGAFWDAFSGAGPSKRDWDADKVRKVLEGKAVVRVVDVEPTPAPSKPDAGVAALEESMRALSVDKARPAPKEEGAPAPAPAGAAKEEVCTFMRRPLRDPSRQPVLRHKPFA